jgi:hypothetical protein
MRYIILFLFLLLISCKEPQYIGQIVDFSIVNGDSETPMMAVVTIDNGKKYTVEITHLHTGEYLYYGPFGYFVRSDKRWIKN